MHVPVLDLVHKILMSFGAPNTIAQGMAGVCLVGIWLQCSIEQSDLVEQHSDFV